MVKPLRRTKKGAILLGVAHSGVDSAARIIAEIEKHGIVEGDVVAIELSQKELDELKNKVRTGGIDGDVKFIKSWVNEALRLYSIKKIESPNEVKEIVAIYVDFKRRLDGLLFLRQLVRFFIKKKAKLVGYEIGPAFRRRLDTMMTKTVRSRITGEEVPTKKERRLLEFMKLPMREEKWKQKLQSSNPKFVLTGAGHLSAVRRAIPYQMVINLASEFRGLSLADRLRDEAIRLRYKAYKLKKKMTKKKKPKRTRRR